MEYDICVRVNATYIPGNYVVVGNPPLHTDQGIADAVVGEMYNKSPPPATNFVKVLLVYEKNLEMDGKGILESISIERAMHAPIISLSVPSASDSQQSTKASTLLQPRDINTHSDTAYVIDLIDW